MWYSCIPNLFRLRGRASQAAAAQTATSAASESKDIATLLSQECDENAEGMTSTDSDVKPHEESPESRSDPEIEEGNPMEVMKDDAEEVRIKEVGGDAQPPLSAEGAPRGVAVHLPSGKPVIVQDARTVAEARCQVAVACAVCPTQVQICTGRHTLSSQNPLRLDDIKEGLTAVIQTWPVEAAVIPQGAGVFCLKHLSPERCMHIRSSSQLVKLPKGVRRRDWIAAHVCRVHDEVATIPARLGDICTPESCPRMDAGLYRYTWTQQEDGKSVNLCAREYMRRAISQLQSTLFDAEKFPLELSQLSEDEFRATVVTILKRAFAIYAHTYHSHIQAIQAADADFFSYLNFCFKHLIYFVLEFELLERQDLDPMRGYVHQLEDLYFAA
mmetsp:Transcript_35661/g.80525  ORF Transcript_35661/g.80525 Transcript_35661/m.80525 type:complete len:385 (-) Transcript_35661:53-1207(-)